MIVQDLFSKLTHDWLKSGKLVFVTDENKSENVIYGSLPQTHPDLEPLKFDPQSDIENVSGNRIPWKRFQ